MRTALLLLLGAGGFAPAGAGERPVEKTLWLTLPVSLRSPTDQASRVIRWYIYFGKDGTAFMTDEGSGAEHGAVMPPNLETLNKRNAAGFPQSLLIAGPLTALHVRTTVRSPTDEIVVGYYLNVTETGCTVLRSEFSVTRDPTQPPVSYATGAPTCQLFQGRHLDR